MSQSPRVNRNPASGALPFSRAPCRNAGYSREQREGWRAIVGDEAREEERRIGVRQIGGAEAQRVRVEEIPHMIERHENDDDPAQVVDARQPLRSLRRVRRDANSTFFDGGDHARLSFFERRDKIL